MQESKPGIRMILIPDMREAKQSKQSRLHTRTPVVVPDAPTDLHDGIAGPGEIRHCQQVQWNDLRLVGGDDPQAFDRLLTLFFRQLGNRIQEGIRQGNMRIGQENAGRIIATRDQLFQHGKDKG